MEKEHFMEIGSLSLTNNFLLAPMAGVTNLPFRSLARRFGCSLAFTEMISAIGLVRGTDKSYRFLDSAPDDKPLGVQIFGSDANVLVAAAQIAAEKGADLVDLNMGCPVRKVIKTGAGVALMQDPVKVSHILKSLRQATSLPLTVKIRSGWNKRNVNAVMIARIAEGCGVNSVIVHPRTADQGFSGLADWMVIREVKNSIGIPVIGSGDVRKPQDAHTMMTMTGCDGVMIGRSSLGNPWIFKDIISYCHQEKEVSSLSISDRKRVITDHLNKEILYLGEYSGIRNFRKHLLWYTKGMRNSAQLRQKLSGMVGKNEILREIDDFFYFGKDTAADNKK